jgi:hypothetical protein
MAINSVDEFKSKLQGGLGAAYNHLEPTEIEFAINQALSELGWTLPITELTRESWAIKRGKRHALDVLCTVSAHKFKYKQINLNQRFEHYFALIKTMDEEYRWALENDLALIDVSSTDMFGVYIRNGFVYDQYGRDVTKYLHSLGYDTTPGGYV